jgi:hypothetical protein
LCALQFEWASEPSLAFKIEVALSADILDYYAENAERFLAPQPLTPASG